MTKVGIITMHRVYNVGSVLQAYALQEFLNKNGYEAQIIDYLYPNKLHKSFLEKDSVKIAFSKKIVIYFLRLILGNNKKLIKKFVNEKLCLSDLFYETHDALLKNPPLYDIYCTGSDQVWNPRFCCNDGAFFLDFVKDRKKISYASSISVPVVDDTYKKFLMDNLISYKSIGVREKSSVKLLSTLLKKDISFNCDPTLLLEKEQWETLLENKKRLISKRYVLFYLLTYSFDPFPKVYDLIDKIISETGLYPVFLYGRYKQVFMNGKVVFKAGPLEFINLVKNAELVVTSSFHGTCFSLIFNKQFYSLAKSYDDNSDERLQSLLQQLGLENRLLYDDNNYFISDDSSIDYDIVNRKLSDYVLPSKEYLLNNLKELS